MDVSGKHPPAGVPKAFSSEREREKKMRCGQTHTISLLSHGVNGYLFTKREVFQWTRAAREGHGWDGGAAR